MSRTVNENRTLHRIFQNTGEKSYILQTLRKTEGKKKQSKSHTRDQENNYFGALKITLETRIPVIPSPQWFPPWGSHALLCRLLPCWMLMDWIWLKWWCVTVWLDLVASAWLSHGLLALGKGSHHIVRTLNVPMERATLDGTEAS